MEQLCTQLISLTKRNLFYRQDDHIISLDELGKRYGVDLLQVWVVLITTVITTNICVLDRSEDQFGTKVSPSLAPATFTFSLT